MTERLIFGQPPPKESARLKRERRRHKPIASTEDLRVYSLKPLLIEAVLDDTERWRESRGKYRGDSERVLQSVWGEDTEVVDKISPSLAASCLRWVGYEVLSEELKVKPAPRTFKSEMALKIGQGGHDTLLKVLSRYGTRELRVLHDDPEISGRLDFMIKNPVTKEYQILDLKFSSDYGFRQITREGLPDYLKRNSRIYNPSPEARLQILIYMWIKRQEGFNVAMGNIIYINKNSGALKECLIPWDEIAEYDVEQFLAQIKRAREKIANKELPEPTVQSKYICASFCPFRLHCEYGQRYAAGRIKKESKRRPNWVYKKARQQAEERQKKMELLGVVQPKLLDL
jgi:hypothetical protein